MAWRDAVKIVSVVLKIAAGIVGLAGAAAWITSTHPIADAAIWNGCAAVLTALAVGAQAISALIEAKVPPTGGWG